MTPHEGVRISEYRIAWPPSVLVAFGLGSCVGITLYDPVQRLGGLAHTLLPAPRPGLSQDRMGKFVQTAIGLMLEELVRQGGQRQHLGAKVVGGADMFEPLHTPAEEGIGARNVLAAREALKDLGIPLLAEDTGGSHGRTVEFNLATGEVLVHAIRSDRLLKTL